MSYSRLTWAFAIGLCLFLSGCSSWVRTEQPVQSGSINLSSESNIGQTFTVHYAGLQGISLNLTPVQSGQGNLQLSLYSSPSKEIVLADSILPIARVASPGWYRFPLAVLPASNQQDYYFELELTGPGAIAVSTGPGDAYLNGALYQDGKPLDSQASFRLTYAPGKATIGLAGEGLFWLVLLLVGGILFILPGWGLLIALYPRWHGRSWPEKVGLAGGLSLAIYPLVFLWTDLIGLHLGQFYAWIPPVVGAGIILFQRIRSPRQSADQTRPQRAFTDLLPDLALVLIFGLILFSRFWVIRGLLAPMWGDSLQHTMIARLLVDHHGLFNSWEPYASLTSFTYHFGFHSLVAVYHWGTQLPLAQATLWTGQLTNLLAILALIPLAIRLGKNKWAGVIAMLVAGLLSPMPQEYTNWGRYTQLAGQAILPIAIFFGWDLLEQKSINWRTISLVWLLMGGLALTHYRILIFAILFYVVYFLFYFRSRGVLWLFQRISLAGIGGAILFLPWFVHAFSGGIINLFARQISIPVSQATQFTLQSNGISSLSPFLPGYIWIAYIMAIAWGLLKREGEILLVIIWWFLILLSANPAWLNLPGTGAIGSFTVLIAAYIPVGLALGAAAGWMVNSSRLQVKQKRLLAGLQPVLLFLILGGGVWGAFHRLQDIKPGSFTLFTRPDQRASDWIEQNLPANANLLVNAFFAYGNSLIVGADGGWWLPLTAHRQITVPPINYATEKGPVDGYRLYINSLQAEIQAKGIDSPEVLNELHNRGIEFIYLGQRQGSVNNPTPGLNADQLLNSPSFDLIYQQDRVKIFKVAQPQP